MTETVCIVTYNNADDDYYMYIWGVYRNRKNAIQQEQIILKRNNENCGFRVRTYTIE